MVVVKAIGGEARGKGDGVVASNADGEAGDEGDGVVVGDATDGEA